MTKDEVLKLALKTLEYAGPSWIDARQPAITAIKEALANEALEKMAENARELGLDYEPEPVPVAVVRWNDIGHISWRTHVMLSDDTPLYTTPPQRTWIGLTRTELIKCGVLPYGMSYELYEAIEAKLKAKNETN